MNYPVTHRVPIEGHPCWPFRWEHERIASGMEAGTVETEGLDPKDDSPVGSEASETHNPQHEDSADARNVSRNLSSNNSRKV